ncbi:MAG TPA: hypothetical protein DCG79_01255 [Clostridiales bacterium]|nr:hypothetical protein [Clostridiales bacterium]
MKIGVLDSGIGGLNVLAALIKHRCGDGYVYLSDGKNLPYGSKSGEELKRIALLNARRLVKRGVGAIVFGCNTLSVAALDHVRKKVVPPVFGLVPRPELLSGKGLLLCTPGTALFLPQISGNVCVLTPSSLAVLIDGEYPKTQATENYLRPLLLPYRDAEEVYLGCSHYLFAKEVVKQVFPQAEILDGVEHLAALVSAVLPEEGSKNPSMEMIFTGEDQTERYLAILSSLLK